MKLTVSFDMGENVSVEHVFEFPDGTFVKGMSVSMEAGPILRTPFYLHGERLHTICSRKAEADVASVDWSDPDKMPPPVACQPIGCDAGIHLPGCQYAVVDDPTTDVICEVEW